MHQTRSVFGSDFLHLGRVEEHVATIHIFEVGVLTEGHIQTDTVLNIDDIAREPAHTGFTNVSRVVRIGRIGFDTEFLTSLTILVDGSVTAHEEAVSTTFVQALVHTHLDDGAAAPLASVGSKDDVDAIG